MTLKHLSFSDLPITPADLFDQMGYGTATPDEQTWRETQAIIGEVRQWLSPQFCFFVRRDLPPFHIGSIIEKQLQGSEAYALFICTAGTEYEEWQQQLKEQGDMVRCADVMEQHLQQNIDKLGWRHTNRFSPGYCGWHVSEQQLLFPLFAGHTCDVHLTDSSLMVPIKSVSGLIGLGKKVRRLDYTCGLCDFEHCYKRRKR